MFKDFEMAIPICNRHMLELREAEGPRVNSLKERRQANYGKGYTQIERLMLNAQKLGIGFKCEH
jgi:hypothetical protein